VKGLVATLINLPDTSHQYSTALEIAAGGKLYNVVVEDEKVGSQLLQNGKLKKRVTIIPLNKINAFKLSAEVCDFISKHSSYFLTELSAETQRGQEDRSEQGSSCTHARRFP
jgi:chromosome segregation ATPase